MPVVIAFISQKGGVGKSTLARALAAITTAAGFSVKLADLDPLQRTLLLWDKTRKQNNIEPALVVESFAEEGEALAQARGVDLLILDTPAQVKDNTMNVARRAHLIVQPTGPSLDDLHPSVLLFRALANLGIPQERLIFAITRFLSAREEERSRAFLTAEGYVVLPGGIPERIAYRDAHDHGLALTETDDDPHDKQSLALMGDLYLRITVAVEALKKRKQARE